MYCKLLILAFVAFVHAQETKYTVFVVDDTGSMEEEIEAVKTWLRNCLDGKYPNCLSDQYILTTFNDPYVGNITGPTNNISQVIDHIDSLFSFGGYDCPELRYEGMQQAVDAVPPIDETIAVKGREATRCKIFLFTDATAKDGYLRPEVEESILEKGCSLFPLLTGCCGECPNACDAVSEEYCINHVIDTTREVEEPKKRRRRDADDDDSDYRYGVEGDADPNDTIYLYQLAEKTGGSIYVIEKPSLPEEMLVILEEEVSFGFCPTDQTAGPLPQGFKCQDVCEANGMCWDKSIGRCYCNDASSCPRISSSDTLCPEPFKEPKCRKDAAAQYFRSPRSCKKFTICVFGKKYKFVCPEGKVFGGEKCQDPSEVKRPCGYKE